MAKRFSENLYNKLYLDLRTDKICLYIPATTHYLEIDFSTNPKFHNALLNDKIYNFGAFKLLMERIFDHLRNESDSWDRVFGYSVVAIIHNKYNEVELNALEDAIRYNNVVSVDFIESPIPQTIFYAVQQQKPTIYIDFSKNNTRIGFISKLKYTDINHLDKGIARLLDNLAMFVNSKYRINISLYELEKEILNLDEKELLIKSLNLKSRNTEIKLHDIEESLISNLQEINIFINKYVEEVARKNKLVQSEINFYLGGDILKSLYIKGLFKKISNLNIQEDLHNEISKFIGINLLRKNKREEIFYIKDTLFL